MAGFQYHMTFLVTACQTQRRLVLEGEDKMMEKVVKSSEPVSRVLSPFILSEKDIPGAKLPKETSKECNFWELHRWLQCRGA